MLIEGGGFCFDPFQTETMELGPNTFKGLETIFVYFKALNLFLKKGNSS